MAVGKALSSRDVSKLEALYANKFMPADVTLESAIGDVRGLLVADRVDDCGSASDSGIRRRDEDPS